MGLATSIAGADFSTLNIGNILFPVPSGLTHLFFPGVDGPTTVKNHVAGGLNGVITGTPVYDAAGKFATFNNNSAGAAYMEIATPLQAAWTVCVIAKEIDGTTDSVLFTQAGETSLCYIGLTGGRLAGAPAAGQIDFVTSDMLNFDGTKYGFYGMRRTGTQMQFSAGYGGSMLTRTLTGMTNRVSASAGSLRFGNFIGNNDFGTGDRTVDMSMIAVFNRSLSDVEMAKVYNDLRTIYARKGISEL